MPELNGSPVSAEQLQALGLLNYGHFTSMTVEHGGARGLELHLQRLVDDSAVLFDAHLDPDWVRSLIRRTVADVTDPVVVRVTVFDPALDLGHPGADAEPQVLVTMRSAARQPAPPLRVTAVPYQRDLPSVKHVGLFGTVYHRRLAQRRNFDDVLFLDQGSRVTEGATWNIGFVDGERVIWPAGDWLPGVTMRLLQRAYDQAVTEPVTLSQVPAMEGAFATNAGTGVRDIAAIDDVPLRVDHPVVKLLRSRYEELPIDRL